MENLNQIVARVHSKESGGTVDGPGIRYVVFMQGCPLRCKFCHNPDTWDKGAGTLVSVADLTHEILKYQSFMKLSKGGLTVSGGEPLLHKNFLNKLFEQMKVHKIHVALDTSGFIPVDEEIDRILDKTDLVLLDIKHLNNAAHKELTGVANDNTMAFLNHLRVRGIKTWIRWVVLPGMTDSNEYAEQFGKFISEYPNVELVELLPYHDSGKFKWAEMGMKYPLEHLTSPTKQDIARIVDILKKYGVKTLTAE